MKRIISLCCAALIMVFSMAVPALAAESDFDSFSMIQVLDYSTANGLGNFRILQSGDNYITFALPTVAAVRRIDMIVFMDTAPSSVSYVAPNGNEYSMTVLSLGNQAYRIYGEPAAWDTPQLKIKFTATRTCWVDFKSVYVDYMQATYFDARLYGSLDYYDGTVEFIKDRAVTTPAYANIHFSSDVNSTEFYSFLNSPDWAKYDFLDIQLLCNFQSITSVSAVMGSINLPMECTVVDNSALGSSYYLTIRVDLRGLDRNSTDYPMVILAGNLLYDEYSTIRIMNCNGVIVDESENFLTYWFRRFLNKLDEVKNALSGDTTPGDQFQDEVDNRGDQLNDMADVMDSVSKPAVEDFDISLDAYVNDSDIQVLATPINVLLEAEIFSRIIFISLILATVSFVLYGKR